MDDAIYARCMETLRNTQAEPADVLAAIERLLRISALRRKRFGLGVERDAA